MLNGGTQDGRNRMKTIGHWIQGRPIVGGSGRVGPVYNPARGVPAAEVVFASRAEVEDAVKSAVGAAEGWGMSSLTDVEVGMIGINVPIPVPVAWHSFGGWKASLFGDAPIYGPEGIRFYTQPKVVTSRWPDATPSQLDLGFPTTRCHHPRTENLRRLRPAEVSLRSVPVSGKSDPVQGGRIIAEHLPARGGPQCRHPVLDGLQRVRVHAGRVRCPDQGIL
jgi:hypothetical protein